MKTIHLTVMLILALLCPSLSGCKPDPNAEFIQGLWYFKDPHFDHTVSESHQSANWLFENYVFQLSTCCFTEEEVKGKYSIMESEGNLIKLELFNMVGQSGGYVYTLEDTIVIVIKIDRESGTIMVNRSGPFNRITPYP